MGDNLVEGEWNLWRFYILQGQTKVVVNSHIYNIKRIFMFNTSISIIFCMTDINKFTTVCLLKYKFK